MRKLCPSGALLSIGLRPLVANGAFARVAVIRARLQERLPGLGETVLLRWG